MSQQVKPLAAFALLLPLIYVLSIGPVAMLCTRYNWDSDLPEKIYAPVFWLHEHTALKKPLEYYVELWIGRP